MYISLYLEPESGGSKELNRPWHSIPGGGLLVWVVGYSTARFLHQLNVGGMDLSRQQAGERF